MTGIRISDFIIQGVIAVRGEHIYMRLDNPFSEDSYLFHLPKSLFCTMIKNRIIEKDESVWKKNEEKENKEKEKQANILSKTRMYG